MRFISTFDPAEWTPRQLVMLPLGGITFVFGLIVLFFAFGLQTSILPIPALIVTGVTLYLVAMFVLSRIGLASVDRLEHLGLTDSLSGLPNRRALHRDVASSAGPGSEVAIALVDLDGFKQVNDTYGHSVGDSVLKICASRLTELCGEDATCYRLGGDEFAIAVVGPIAGNILEGISRRIVDAFHRPLAVEDRRIIIGASIGLARSNGSDGLSSSELLREADVAMYASKRGGKMRCTWFIPEFDANRESKRELDGELRKALGRNEFKVHYQPLVDANNGQIVAVESLLRWERSEGPAVGPNVFIPIAEESGFINNIGLWVLRQSCSDARDWGDIKVSVNISAAQLRNPEFPIQVGQILEETAFPADRLELEVTETCLVLDPVVVGRSLDVLRQFGVSVVLDDFGTGYASIGFLRQFRFEKLKLDRSLITSAEGDDGSRAMMLSSISVARAMEMAVTAEGVETEAQATLARTAGCDQIQGWLYYRAMPSNRIEELLAKASENSDRDSGPAEVA